MSNRALYGPCVVLAGVASASAAFAEVPEVGRAVLDFSEVMETIAIWVATALGAGGFVTLVMIAIRLGRWMATIESNSQKVTEILDRHSEYHTQHFETEIDHSKWISKLEERTQHLNHRGGQR